MQASNRQIASHDTIYEQTLAGIIVPQRSMSPDCALPSQYLRQNGFYHYICLCCR